MGKLTVHVLDTANGVRSTLLPESKRPMDQSHFFGLVVGGRPVPHPSLSKYPDGS